MTTPDADTARHQRVKALFLDVLDRPEAERAACLAAWGDGDEVLRTEVAALLAAHAAAQATGHLDRPLLDRDDGALDDPMVGRAVGPWRLGERIGEGGMGAVYRAERADGAYERAVAVKLLHPGPGLDRSGVLSLRLTAERRILARFEHPGIARLYDGGVTPEGAPFLVMELVDGAPLTAYAEQRGLSVEARLRLFLQVCDAVAYAHRHLVVHRDLKPSNVLVAEDPGSSPGQAGGGPQVKLLDFGIATLLEEEGAEAGRTHTVGAMTPAYAAPEQLRPVLGEITMATDVYALGVLLYELLAGRRPYELTGRTASAVERVVCETAPPRPSLVAPDPARAGRLRGDLDLIAAKALAKEPERRYASAEALAEDLRRHLDGLPVAARPASAGYRVRKFVARHRAGVAVAASVLGLVGALVGFYTARLATERDTAERRFDIAREAARALLFDVHDAVADLPGSTATREDIVRRSLDYLDALAAEAGADAALRLDLAQAYLRVGNVLGNPNDHNLGRLGDARASYRRGLSLLPGAPPDTLAVSVAHVRGVLHEKLADVAAYSGDPEGALALMDSALALYRGNVAAEPADPNRLVVLAIGHLKRGDYTGNPNHPNAGRHDEALRHYTTTVTLLGRARAVLPDTTSEAMGALRLVGIAHEREGTLFTVEGRLGDALDAFDRSLAIREDLATRQPTNTDVRRDVGIAHEKLGDVYRARGWLEEALAEYRTAAAVYEALAEADPDNVQAWQTLALGLLHLGDVLGAPDGPSLDRPGAARLHYERARGLLRRVVAADTANQQARIHLTIAEARFAGG